MIPQNELRTGNWVTDNTGSYRQITSGADIDKAKTYNAIAINDKILERCGFVFNDYFKLWQKKETLPKAGFEMETDRDYNVRDFGHRYIGVQLSSVHQLQNLFFQLKGSEIPMTNMEAALTAV